MTTWPVLAVVASLALAGCAASTPPRPVPTITRTVTAPPKVITRVITKKIPEPGPTVTVDVPGRASIPCTDEDGQVDPGVVLPGITQGATTCTVGVLSPPVRTTWAR